MIWNKNRRKIVFTNIVEINTLYEVKHDRKQRVLAIKLELYTTDLANYTPPQMDDRYNKEGDG